MRRPLTAAVVAAVAAVALSPVPGAAVSDETARGVDVSPPAIGSCRATTLAEAMATSDPDPAVACTQTHTALTFKVVDLGPSPDWSDLDVLGRTVVNRCTPAWRDVLGGDPKVITRSMYTYFWFIPTKAQREAGASWARCDASLLGGRGLAPLPGQGDIALGGLPLPDRVAKCRAGKRMDYAYTVCSRPHAFRATVSVKYPHRAFPGKRASERFAKRACAKRMTSAYFTEHVASRAAWKIGYRHAVCLPQTKR